MYNFESTKIIFVGSNLKRIEREKIFKLRKGLKMKTYLIINTNLQSLSTQLEAAALVLLTPLLMEGRMKLYMTQSL